jgi:hypothetical protein
MKLICTTGQLHSLCSDLLFSRGYTRRNASGVSNVRHEKRRGPDGLKAARNSVSFVVTLIQPMRVC